ncbi:MAG: hypothetical protein FLDDKLPJ_02069 [Phycisphaerae bacterium]|nr:hypothetical protein [Phycisphaerae bacterium]
MSWTSNVSRSVACGLVVFGSATSVRAAAVPASAAQAASATQDDSAATVPPPSPHEGAKDRTAPATPAKSLRRTSCPPPPELLTVSGFTSVQVNVDGDGLNILDDAANEPSIAIDPTNPDNIVIGWRQFDSIDSDFRQAGYGVSHDAGRTWVFPGSLAPGFFGSDPVLAADADGVFYYMSIDFSECRLFRSFTAGDTWEDYVQVFPAFRDKEWFTVDRSDGIGRGNLYAIWSANEHFTRSTDGGLTWMRPINIPLISSPWGTVTVDPDGVVYACDRNFNVVRSFNAQDPDQQPTFTRTATVNLGGSFPPYPGGGPNPGGLLAQPWIATDHSAGPARGNVYLLCSVNPPGEDIADVRFARSTDQGATWTPSIRVNDDAPGASAYQWFGTLSVAPTGRLDAAWYDTRTSQEDSLSEVFYAYSTDAGDTWSPNVRVAPVFNSLIGWPRQNKIGDYIGSISDEAGMNLAYAATYNGEQDVYFVRIAPDCNGNGLHDGDDIASGRSRDADGDGLPDECAGVECDAIDTFKTVCRDAKLIAKIRSSLPEGTLLTIDNSGDRLTMTVGADGRGKVKWKEQSGPHTVFIIECPRFARDADCR